MNHAEPRDAGQGPNGTDEDFSPTFPPTEDEAELQALQDDLDDSPEEAEILQSEEIHSGLQSDDEEWEQELTGERPDNGYLPGQRIAEHGIDKENFPASP